MKKNLICIFISIFFIIILVGCTNTKYTVANMDNKAKQEEEQKALEKEKAKTRCIELLESGQPYEEMEQADKTYVLDLLKNWESQDEDFKNKYASQKEFLEKCVKETLEKWKVEEEERKKLEESTPQNVTLKYTAKYGKVVEANKLGKNLTIKFKIEPSISNKTTIDQNGFNVEDLIVNQGGDNFDTISYWAVADMEDGSEGKVISFTIDKNLIQSIKDKKVFGQQIYDKAKDVWILPSLKS